MTNFRVFSWNAIEEACYSIKYQILEKNEFNPDFIIALSRGGLIPARILSDCLRVKNMVIIETSLYDKVNESKKQVIIDGHDMEQLSEYINKKALIVDDIYDSGSTLKALKTRMDNDYKGLIDYKIAVLTIKSDSIDSLQHNVDYYYYVAKKDEWVVHPWEKIECGI